MKEKSILKKFNIYFAELLAGPKKKIIGKWHLYEYFVDEAEELLHYTEKELKKDKILFVISFLESTEFILAGKFPVKLLAEDFNEGKWSISRNYITFIHPVNFRNNIEFQFAFEKGNLKLLKKDSDGKIQFFGFFRKEVKN